MRTGHVTRDLDAHARGRLPAQRQDAVEQHLRGCGSCRAELELVRRGQQSLAALTAPSAAPVAWETVTAAVDARRHARRTARRAGFAALAAAAAVTVMLVGWSVATREEPATAELPPQPPVQARNLALSDLKVGARIVTTRANERVTLNLGWVGRVEVYPATELRVARKSPLAVELELVRGQIHPVITAPARVFVVSTPSARAIDLGCSYLLTVFDDGSGFLRVDGGAVALVAGDREIVVRAGVSCSIRPGLGPVAPFARDAPRALRDLARPVPEGSLVPGLFSARPQDAMTLFYLLSATSGADRAAVRVRLEQLVPAPPGVEPEELEALDPAALARWRKLIEETQAP